MFFSTSVAYGVLFSIGLLVLAGFALVFWWRERAPEHTEEERLPPPLGWPISPEASAALRPVRRDAAARKG
jgi:hypothetical protein